MTFCQPINIKQMPVLGGKYRGSHRKHSPLATGFLNYPWHAHACTQTHIGAHTILALPKLISFCKRMAFLGVSFLWLHFTKWRKASLGHLLHLLAELLKFARGWLRKQSTPSTVCFAYKEPLRRICFPVSNNLQILFLAVQNHAVV